MNRIVIEKRVGAEGVLQLTLSLGAEDAGRDVRVTVEPLDQHQGTTPEEWRAGVLETAGAWKGEFERPGSLPLEIRDPLS